MQIWRQAYILLGDTTVNIFQFLNSQQLPGDSDGSCHKSHTGDIIVSHFHQDSRGMSPG